MEKLDLSFEEYLALPGVNWSSLKHYDRSPAHYRLAIDQEREQTPIMQTGSALHALVLEGELAFTSRYVVAPVGIDRRTKAGKEQWAAFEAEADGKETLTQEQHATVCGMAAAILAHPRAGKLLEKCRERELSITWADFLTALTCKARLDAYDETNGLVVDIKSTDDASPKAFERLAARMLYHGQAAFYLQGLREAGADPARFLFIAVERNPPHGVAVYLADDEMVGVGSAMVAAFLERHAGCMAANAWPGYPVEVQTLSLPRWAA